MNSIIKEENNCIKMSAQNEKSLEPSDMGQLVDWSNWF